MCRPSSRLIGIGVLFMVAGGFFKVGVYIYGAAAATAHLFNLQSYHSVLAPLGLMIIPLGLIMAKNFTQFNSLREFNYFFVYLPLQFVIPSLLLVISYIQKKAKLGMKYNGTNVNNSHDIE